jgi:hypothetical protein
MRHWPSSEPAAPVSATRAGMVLVRMAAEVSALSFGEQPAKMQRAEVATTQHRLRIDGTACYTQVEEFSDPTRTTGSNSEPLVWALL